MSNRQLEDADGVARLKEKSNCCEERKKMSAIAVVTGGSSGIGMATAVRLATAGYDGLVCGRDAGRLETAEQRIEAATQGERKWLTLAVDLASDAAPREILSRVREEFGRVDLLVNAAGFAANTPFGEISPEEFDRTTAVNMRGVFFLTQAFWPMMVGQKSGVIVNVSSLAAVNPFPGFAAYGSSKAWVDLFTIALANEGRGHGIRAYSIRPGAVETPMLRGLFPDFPAEQTVDPMEIAEMILMVTQVAFRNSSGQAINVARQVG